MTPIILSYQEITDNKQVVQKVIQFMVPVFTNCAVFVGLSLVITVEEASF